MQYNVKAILDWKYNTNGDPMVDVGYFLMMFLQPADYGYQGLTGLDLLMGKVQNEHSLIQQICAGIHYKPMHVHTFLTHNTVHQEMLEMM